MTPESKIYNLAHAQGGVVRADQVLDAGFSRWQIKRRVETGEWRVVSAGVYRLLSLDGRINLARAAVAALPTAVVSHFSAAALHNIPLVPRETVSVVVHAQTTHRFPGVNVFRTLDLVPSHTTIVDGLPTTTPERTIVDLAACLSPRHLSVVVDEVLASGLSDIDRIRGVLVAVARRGRRGVRSLRSVLDDRSDDPKRASKLEKAGLDLLRAAGLVGYQLEYPIPWSPTERYDVAFPTCRIAIEWDSFRWHTQMSAFRNDRRRDREAVLNGWRILRFTWDDVHKSPSDVTATIRAAIGLDLPAA